jgi:hypothetical protein
MASFRPRPLYPGGRVKTQLFKTGNSQKRQVEIIFRKKREINTARMNVQSQRMDK